MELSKIHLIRLRLRVADRTYARVLSTLSEGIRGAIDFLKGLKDEDQEYIDAVQDEESDVIENLLGAAFVVCQTQITAVSSAALAAARAHTAIGKSFPPFTNAESIRGLGDGLRPGFPYSKIEVIWALANYFKHGDEWARNDWKKLTGHPLRTAQVIMAAGASAGSTGNLRTGSEALGNPNYDQLDLFGSIIKTWADKILDVTARELGKYS